MTRIISALIAGLFFAEPVSIFTGKDLAGWKMRDENSAKTWKAASSVQLDGGNPKVLTASGEGGSAGVLFRQVVEIGGDLLSEKEFGDCRLELEFMVPREGNSGIFFMAQYELQACDSFGLPDAKMEGECGSIMWTKGPSTNATRKPGEWQTYDVTFRAPRFDATGKKIQNARFISVILNGKKVQDNVEVKEPTGGEIDKPERPTGPIMIQGNEGQVAFRNIRVTPLELK